MGWRFNLATVVVAGVGVSFALRQEEMRDYAMESLGDLTEDIQGTAAVYSRVAASQIGDDDAVMPLSDDAKLNLYTSIDKIVLRLKENFQLSEENGLNVQPWEAGLMVVALSGHSDVDREQLSRFMATKEVPSCNCWSEFRNIHIGASVWVILAFAKSEIVATDEQIEFLLDKQSPAGWWPMFPAGNKPEYASTYATAWTIMALQAQSRSGQLSEAVQEKTDAALDTALDWLANTAPDQANQWSDYPRYDRYKILSPSLSGVMIHVFHETRKWRESRPTEDPPWLQALDKRWLDELPNDIPRPTEADPSIARIATALGEIPDFIRHYELPWTLVGISHAYRHGSLFQKAMALRWVERALLEEEIVTEQVLNQNQLGSEILYALRQFDDRTGSTVASAQ